MLSGMGNEEEEEARGVGGGIKGLTRGLLSEGGVGFVWVALGLERRGPYGETDREKLRIWGEKHWARLVKKRGVRGERPRLALAHARMRVNWASTSKKRTCPRN